MADIIHSLNYGGTLYPFSLPYGECTTAAGTAAKVVTINNFVTSSADLVKGTVVIIKFTNSNKVANPTLNINSMGAIKIVQYGSTAAGTNTVTSGWTAGAVQLFTYDGSNWVRDYWYNNQYSLSGLGGIGTVSASGTAPLSLSASKSGTSVSITGSLTQPVKGDWWNGGVVTVGSDGVSEMGKHIDFHASDAGTIDYDYRLTVNNGVLNGSGGFSTSTSITAGTSLHATGALTVGTTATIGSYITMTNSNPYVKFVDTADSNKSYTYYVQGYQGKLAFGPTFGNAAQLDESGNLTLKGGTTFTPRTNNSGSVGTSSYKWNAMYATTFVGALSGNATTATTATQLSKNTRMDYGWDGLNYFNISGTAGTAVKANNTPTTAWWHILRFNHANNAGYYTDLAVPFNDTSLYYKRVANGALQNGGWIKVLDTLNYASTLDSRYFTESESNARFVYVSGDTMTGKLTMGASAQSGMTQAVGIHVHDLRSATITPNTFGDQSVNFIFDNRLGTSDWRSAIQIKGWTGEYAAWQLSGGASTAASNKLYYREGVKTSWGTWYSIPFENRANTFTALNKFTGNVEISNLLTVASGASHYGVKIGDTYINAIGGQLIFQNNTAIRFGGDSWDYNVWAGLKYVHSSKTIFLGLADNVQFTANAAQSGGTLALPGVGYVSVNGKRVIQATDSWLRINDGSAHTSGIYFGTSTTRTDGRLEVGNGGAKFYAASDGTGYFDNDVKVKGHVFAYNYGRDGNNAPAFVFDKNGGNYTGIGSHNITDTIWFGAVSSTDFTWVNDYYQNWYFNGNVEVAKQFRRVGISSSWYNGRDNAVVRMTTSSGYSVLASMKTTNGTWDIGNYNSSSWHDILLFNYKSDTSYAKGASDNTVTHAAKLSNAGYLTLLSGLSATTGTFSGKITLTGTTATTSQIAFTRTSDPSYIMAASYFCITPGGKATGVENADLIVKSGSVYPGTTNVTTLGSSSKRWSSIYGTTLYLNGNAYIGTTAGAGTGLSLYSTSTPDTYGIHMSLTSGYGKHGYVQSDWAMYFCFSGADTRGWIFRHAGANVASISSQGHITGNYVTGTWLQTTATTAVTTASKIATLDANGWMYYITPANLVKFKAFTAGAAAGPKINLSVAGTTVTSAAIPSASASASGIVTTGAQTFAGLKTFNGNIKVASVINMTRSDGPSYLLSTGNYVIIPDGKAQALANGTAVFTGSSMYPGTNNSVSSGTSSYRWSAVHTQRLIAYATQDAAAASANKVALITGSPTGQHLEFDDNEIISKSNGTTGGILYINSGGDYTQLYKTVFSTAVYGKTLPTTNLVTGQIYFKLI